MKTKFKKFLNDKKVKVLEKKVTTKVHGGSGTYKIAAKSTGG